MITLILLTAVLALIIALVLIVGGVLVVAWPIAVILVLGLMIDLIFLKRLFGRKKEGKK